MRMRRRRRGGKTGGEEMSWRGREMTWRGSLSTD
jgi:hypothetical protein